MSDIKHLRLVKNATRLKKAWILSCAIIGSKGKVPHNELLVPDYRSWKVRKLRQQVKDLEDDFLGHGRAIFKSIKRRRLSAISAWLADKYDNWVEAGMANFTLARVHEVESAIGKLRARDIVDCPPYAEWFVQGFLGVAIRHPEYHLGTDLALLYNLFLDTEKVIRKSEKNRIIIGTEHQQSLGRNVILTCFNLIESFISGLGHGYVLEHPDTPEEVAKKLTQNYGALKKRMKDVTTLISNGPVTIDFESNPFKDLFGKCKQRRDSFVHCEPGPVETKWGYVKETYFHDITEAVVRETVDLTCEAICTVWKAVHGRNQPTWLPELDESGRFPNVKAKLAH